MNAFTSLNLFSSPLMLNQLCEKKNMYNCVNICECFTSYCFPTHVILINKYAF